MSFRSAPGHVLRWQNTDLPGFSNFAFCEQYYRAHSVLRRVLSLARKLGYRSILCEEIRAKECALLDEENAALAVRCQDFSGSTVHRLTFFRSPPETPPQAHEFLGYAVFKLDEFGPQNRRAHVYEAVLRPVRPAEGNCFIHTQRDFDLTTSAGSGSVRGVLYAQQNNLTFVCAHVAVRTLLSCVLTEPDVTYADLNACVGIDHQNSRVGEGTNLGLSPAQIEAILQSYGVPFRKMTHEPQHGPLPPGIEYQSELYASIESRRPALLGFELAADASGAPPSRHLIPVLGHTFNEDAWMPDAERFYFQRDRGYFRSEAWLSTFVVHDDNVGPYFCLPRGYLSRNSFRILYGVQPAQASLSLAEAEALAYSTLSAIHGAVPALGIAWYDRFAAYGRTQSLVLRSFQIRRRRYLDHLAAITDINGQRFPVAELGGVEAALPEYVWLIEISAPELFPMSRKKFGEIIYPCDRPADGSPARPLFTRLPGLTVRGLAVGRVQPEGYTPVLTLTP